ncbi:hypothetical protein Z517_00232 [Fonsecaea pedrosoi CBS 271.37]|uniref:Uncharacterized protein n=1 Tax=Fonsecaea pedrosoi CBS 271.37 TaxID=1442368 RepID=A0A0D2HK14_9EURO|nr:uncharacterized protein Z517_00232 [Fonsecaea pedrosoi CBS 271.37]KIW84844.1 hypothetical protein Z517_00232 [Fonsecaea pedrosoi CBS 271.37]
MGQDDWAAGAVPRNSGLTVVLKAALSKAVLNTVALKAALSKADLNTVALKADLRAVAIRSGLKVALNTVALSKVALRAVATIKLGLRVDLKAVLSKAAPNMVAPKVVGSAGLEAVTGHMGQDDWAAGAVPRNSGLTVVLKAALSKAVLNTVALKAALSKADLNTVALKADLRAVAIRSGLKVALNTVALSKVALRAVATIKLGLRVDLKAVLSKAAPNMVAPKVVRSKAALSKAALSKAAPKVAPKVVLNTEAHKEVAIRAALSRAALKAVVIKSALRKRQAGTGGSLVFSSPAKVAMEVSTLLQSQYRLP